jgi:hypothetical protein
MNDLNVLIDLYDHEFPKIEKVVAALNAARGTLRDLESFRREAIERFEEIALVVTVQPYTTDQPGVIWFDIDIVGRCTALPHGFDHDQQSWEVQHAILGIDAPGSLSPSGLITPPKSVSMSPTNKS